jgi:hypothetical protein
MDEAGYGVGPSGQPMLLGGPVRQPDAIAGFIPPSQGLRLRLQGYSLLSHKYCFLKPARVIATLQISILVALAWRKTNLYRKAQGFISITLEYKDASFHHAYGEETFVKLCTGLTILKHIKGKNVLVKFASRKRCTLNVSDATV